MRLIDADALLDEYCGECNNAARQICGDNPICVTAMMVKDAQTVEDAVVVVRCKDCSYNLNLKTSTKGIVWCRRFRAEVNTTDFCSYGERKSDNE